MLVGIALHLSRFLFSQRILPNISMLAIISELHAAILEFFMFHNYILSSAANSYVEDYYSSLK